MIRNLATAEQIAEFRASIGAPPPPPAAPARRRKAPELLCNHLVLVHDDGVDIQLPIRTAHKKTKASKFQNIKHRNMTGLALVATHIDRERIEHITFTRVGPQEMDTDDNLRASFKWILDATARFVFEGADMIDANGKVRTDGIGTFDRRLTEERGIKWDYRQSVNSPDRRKHGVRIRFLLRPNVPPGSPT